MNPSGKRWMLMSVVLIVIKVSEAQLLKLRVDPPFVFIHENWTIGHSLPNLKMCAQYTGHEPLLVLLVTSGDPSGYFQPLALNDTCWTLTLEKGLDADFLTTDGTRGQTFSLAFKCTDGRLQAYGNLDIQVMDINDNAPTFVDTPSAVAVPEDTAVGSVVFSVSTFDPDTGVGGIDSFRLEDTYDNTFQIVNGSCGASRCSADLYLMRQLNYDLANVYTLTIVAFDGAGRISTVNTAKLTLVVNVLDVQSNPPRFTTDARTQHVKEDTPVGTQLFQVTAADGDKGVQRPNPIEYSLVGEDGRAFFGINTTNGWVYVRRELNRENPEVLKNNGAFELQIRAQELSDEDPRPSAFQNVTILIVDVDDEPPKCSRLSYRGQIMENSQALIPVTIVGIGIPDSEGGDEFYVYDNDEGRNGEFELELEGEQGVFDITPRIVYNEAKPLIRVKNSSALDYEKIKFFKFRVWLKERGEGALAEACDFEIDVLDVNDNTPYFNQSTYTAAALENQPIGVVVTKVEAMDVDTVQYMPIEYSLGGDGARFFAISKDGTVQTATKLDRELQDAFKLTVTARDANGTGLATTVPLSISVIDANDNAPRFEKQIYEVYVQENSYLFTHLPGGFHVAATDADQPGTPNSNLTYSLEPIPSISDLFAINPWTGRLEMVDPGLDLEDLPSGVLNLTVWAIDQGKPRPLSATAHVVVYVNDTNDNFPTFDQKVYVAHVHENATAGDEVIQVTAYDRDRSEPNRKLAYRIANVQDKFVIDNQFGIIKVAEGARLDRDFGQTDTFSLTILAMDQGLPQRTGTALVNITLLDINNKAPVFTENLYSIAVPENVPVGTSLINVTALDLDDNADLEYRILGYQDAEDESGVPVDKERYDYTKLFSMNSKTGEVKSTGVLDRESLASVSLDVGVRDLHADSKEEQSGTSILRIRLLDVNDNAPVFPSPLYLVSLRENAELGTVIVRIAATDADSNHTLRYGLEKPDQNTANLVEIDAVSGELKLRQEIDFESLHWLNLSVSATDNGVPPRKSVVPVSIRILDENDNSPIFEPSEMYRASIKEDSAPGTRVVQVNASDRDSGSFGRVSYFLLADLTAKKAFFVINETTGVISVADSLDRELSPTIVLTVKAVDDYSSSSLNPGSHESTAMVEVTLIDVNDNSPTFSDKTDRVVTLNENDAVGSRVSTLSAVDPDDPNTGNGVVRYYITGGNATSADERGEEVYLFSLDPQSGQITLAQPLLGRSGVYTLVVQAKDLGIPQPRATNLTMLVQITDYNDHPPKILSPKKGEIIPIMENSVAANSLVGQVEAEDVDQGKNADIRYSIKQISSNEDWRFFSIDQLTGEIFLKQPLDSEKQKLYVILAAACDLGSPPLCDEVEFSVAVSDIDDNCPFFDRPLNYTHHLTVAEDVLPFSRVGEVLPAVDFDTSPQNAQICYDIVGGDGVDVFRLQSRNHTTIESLSLLDREKQAGYSLVVRATDCFNNPLCHSEKLRYKYASSDNSLLQVEVSLLDVNDNIPYFHQRLFRGGVQYDTKVGTRVTRVLASDEDILDQNKLSYSILGPIRPRLASGLLDVKRAPFLVNSSSGDVLTNILFLPQWKGTFEFQVKVNDTGGHSNTANVSIKLLGFDEQVELIFESPPNQVWSKASHIIKLLSVATNSNATIDDVTAWDAAKALKSKTFTTSSKVMVHFLDGEGETVAVGEALKALDTPTTADQKSAKQALISAHHLKFAGENPEPTSLARTDWSLYFVFAGVVGGLVLLMAVLTLVWCSQKARYKRKLKAAKSLAFGPSQPHVPAVLEVPGTNLHTGSNPLWNGDLSGMDNFGLDYDSRSTASADRNSLDENTIDLAWDRQSLRSNGMLTPQTQAYHGNNGKLNNHMTSNRISQPIMSNGGGPPYISGPYIGNQPANHRPPPHKLSNLHNHQQRHPAQQNNGSVIQGGGSDTRGVGTVSPSYRTASYHLANGGTALPAATVQPIRNGKISRPVAIGAPLAPNLRKSDPGGGGGVNDSPDGGTSINNDDQNSPSFVDHRTVSPAPAYPNRILVNLTSTEL